MAEFYSGGIEEVQNHSSKIQCKQTDTGTYIDWMASLHYYKKLKAAVSTTFLPIYRLDT